MKTVFKYATPFWLGFSLGAFGHITYMQWQFWAIFLPVIVFNATYEILRGE